MRSSTYSTWLVALAGTAYAQTFTTCNPLNQQCPPDPALGKSTEIDFSAGQSDQFSATGNPTYDSDGAKFAVAKSGDSPTIMSDWYMMFGHVEVVMQAAPGAGIVSSMVLQSNCLDEIDFEWLGGDGAQVQSNYFGKGQTTTYNRGAFHPNPGNHDGFHTYTIDWTSDQIVWQIDGSTVRALSSSQAEAGQYPQTPMQLKLGIWSGGDPSNPPGTVQWSGGPTQYSNGPFTMIVKSIKATDYSTGTEYTYGDSSGTWQSIKSNGGSISGTGSGEMAEAASSAAAAAPSVTDPATGNPLPFDGTHREASSTIERPSVWPWVPSESATNVEATSINTNLPGLPDGWTVSDTGKVVPPSSASVSEPLPSSSIVFSPLIKKKLTYFPHSTFPPGSPSWPSSASWGGSFGGESGSDGSYAQSNAPAVTAPAVLPSSATTLATSSSPTSSHAGNGTAGTAIPSAPIATGGGSKFQLSISLSLFCGAFFGALLL